MKNSLSSYIFLVVTLTFGVLIQPVYAETFDHSYKIYDHVLKQYVYGGLVDYAGLKSNPKELEIVLNAMAAVSKNEFQKFNKDEQLAFLINLYNAQTLKLIIDHYPIKSIRDIGWFWFFKGPWDQPVISIFGTIITLNTLENDIIRTQYNEPRIHFALVCAALSCPPLRKEAYIPMRLNEQLDDQGRIFLSSPQKNRVDFKNHILYLSPIFKWFSEDFDKASGSVLAFVLPYFPPAVSSEISKGKYKIEYTEYNWSLNEK